MSTIPNNIDDLNYTPSFTIGSRGNGTALNQNWTTLKVYINNLIAVLLGFFNQDGTVKDNAIATANIQAQAVTKAKLSSDVQTTLDTALTSGNALALTGDQTATGAKTFATVVANTSLQLKVTNITPQVTDTTITANTPVVSLNGAGQIVTYTTINAPDGALVTIIANDLAAKFNSGGNIKLPYGSASVTVTGGFGVVQFYMKSGNAYMIGKI